METFQGRNVFLKRAVEYLWKGTMSHGSNNAKQIVIDEAMELAEALQNGSAGDSKVQGKAISLLVRMLTPIYKADLVTIQECEHARKRCHDSVLETIEERHQTPQEIAYKAANSKAKMHMKLGPIEFSGGIVPVAFVIIAWMSPFIGTFYVLGKVENWF